jgi:hypothetical protein
VAGEREERGREGQVCRAMWSGEEVSTSDHKPVAALLVLPMRSHRPRWWPDGGCMKGHMSALRRPRVIVPSTLSHAWGQSPAANPARIMVRPTLVAWRMQLLTLEATDFRAADSNGLSDPFIVFQGPALLKCCTTSVKHRTLQAHWDASELPSLTLFACTTCAFREERIFMSAMDHDLMFSRSREVQRRLGAGVLEGLGEYMTASGDPMSGTLSFDLPLFYRGRERGRIAGTFSLNSVDPVSTGLFIKEKSTQKAPVPLNSTIYERTKGWLSFLRTNKPVPSEKEEDRPQSHSVTYLGHEESQDDILLPPAESPLTSSRHTGSKRTVSFELGDATPGAD